MNRQERFLSFRWYVYETFHSFPALSCLSSGSISLSRPSLKEFRENAELQHIAAQQKAALQVRHMRQSEPTHRLVWRKSGIRAKKLLFNRWFWTFFKGLMVTAWSQKSLRQRQKPKTSYIHQSYYNRLLSPGRAFLCHLAFLVIAKRFDMLLAKDLMKRLIPLQCTEGYSLFLCS